MHLDRKARYELTDEFLTIWKAISRGEEVEFDGDYLQVKGDKLLFPPLQKPYLPLYFGGSSAIAQQIAAKHVDLCLP